MYFNVLLDDGAIKPSKAHPADAGFDLYSRADATIAPGESFCFDTGVHIEIPVGIVGMLKSKSGLNCKYGIQGEGVIDSGYTGSIVVKLYNNSKDPYTISKGDKISQIVFLPIPTVSLRIVSNGLAETDRGENGFGSSGK